MEPRNRSIRNMLQGHEDSVFCVDVSNDDLNALTGDYDGNIIYWNLDRGSKIFYKKEHSGSIISVKISNNKKFAISCGQDIVILIWNLDRRVLHNKVDGFTQTIWKVLITNDDKYGVSMDHEKGLSYFDLMNPVEKKILSSWKQVESWFYNYKELKGQILRYLPEI